MFVKFIKYVGKNFGNPRGIGGIISTIIMNIINQPQYKSILENINLENNDNILDIGFGNGYLIYKLFQKNVPIKVFGIEISDDMLKKVSKKYDHIIRNDNLKLYLENIEKTSFENETFDKICTINTIYFWNDLQKCFSEIKRIIKPNGIFLNVIYSKDFLDKLIYTKYGFKKFTKDELKKITEENGMNVIKVIEIRKNKSYCIISKK